MSEPLLVIDNLHVDYVDRRGITNHAVRGVSLQLGKGEVLALVGESGSGKSTTANAVIGLLGRNAQITDGGIRFDGQTISALPERKFRALRGARIGFVPQDPTVSLNPVLRIGKQIGDVAVIHGLANCRNAEAFAIEVLERVGISEPRLRVSQYPHEISGGMRQRVLIGMALLCRPDLLVADEPTSALDVTVQKRILDLMAELTGATGTSVLLITHDLGVAADRADRVVVMQNGEIVEEGPTGSLLAAPKAAYTKQLLAAAPSLSTTPIKTRRESGDVLVSCRDLARTFGTRRDSVKAVDKVSFDIRRGETLALVGESGSGKSTTARMIAGLARPDAGAIHIDGQDITGLKGAPLRDFRRNVQMIYQNPFASLNPRMSVAEIIREPLRAFGVGSRPDQYRAVDELLDAVGLPRDFGKRRPRELSGGQRQRVAIARALTLKPKLLILDEPVSALDVSVQAQILRLLVDLQERFTLTYLLISHDLAVVRQVSDHIGVMQNGKLVEIGTTEQIFAAPVTDYARDLLSAIPGGRETPQR